MRFPSSLANKIIQLFFLNKNEAIDITSAGSEFVSGRAWHMHCSPTYASKQGKQDDADDVDDDNNCNDNCYNSYQIGNHPWVAYHTYLVNPASIIIA